ncbi:peptidyl-prolyl cis-trans isomerase, FKBP-type family protein [Tritrichomonas foetus]|uniref:peptidylprolyl isomerase n=1 Tax=Tritrichomonas foetus TaxID=1144522 RepID=A0A1J4KBB4_9EUKA|nr:peptidyl-prolyl cis-trans isomerase, FKBP-type family protein [Tritrichomonas foetus]|eukprot:OHT06990.1 peptidyl-prolyl cis-trans isomerase, FKBP-type family protein [Tritrichomonas foetus]
MEALFAEGKIKKDVIKEGDGPFPQDGDRVKVEYVATIKETGKIFDDTKKNGNPFKFVVGKSDIEIWSLGVKTMKVGEHSKFEFDSTFAYGEKVTEVGIPANTQIVIDVELIKIMETFENIDDAISRAEQINEMAANKFRGGDLDSALDLYNDIFDAIDGYTNDKISEIECRTFRNLSIVHGRKGNWKQSLKYADDVLLSKEDDLKALMRKIEALINLENLDKAKETLEHAILVSKNDPAFLALRGKLENAQKLKNKRENEQYAKMFKQ